MGPIAITPHRAHTLALAVAVAVVTGVATSPRRTRTLRPGIDCYTFDDPVVPSWLVPRPVDSCSQLERMETCELRGFTPAPRPPERRACDQLEPGCWIFDHPGYEELRDWLAPHPIGYWFRSNATDLDGDGRIDCFTAVLTLDGWRVDARHDQLSCVQGDRFDVPAPYVMSRHLHAASGLHHE